MVSRPRLREELDAEVVPGRGPEQPGNGQVSGARSGSNAATHLARPSASSTRSARSSAGWAMPCSSLPRVSSPCASSSSVATPSSSPAPRAQAATRAAHSAGLRQCTRQRVNAVSSHSARPSSTRDTRNARRASSDSEPASGEGECQRAAGNCEGDAGGQRRNA